MNRLLFVSLLLLCSIGMSAGLPSGQRVLTRGFMEMGHNSPMQYSGGVGVIVDAPLTNYFTLIGGVYVPIYKERIIKNAWACDVSTVVGGKVNFPLKGGRMLFFENRYLFRALNAYRIYELNSSLSVGGEFAHFLCVLGVSSRLVAAYNYDPADGNRFVSEPFNLLYCVEGYLFKRGQKKWNVGLRFSNYRPFKMEHSANPYYGLLGRYTLSSRLNLLADAGIRPTGIFNFSADYYESYLNIGVNYQW